MAGPPDQLCKKPAEADTNLKSLRLNSLRCAGASTSSCADGARGRVCSGTDESLAPPRARETSRPSPFRLRLRDSESRRFDRLCLDLQELDLLSQPKPRADALWRPSLLASPASPTARLIPRREKRWGTIIRTSRQSKGTRRRWRGAQRCCGAHAAGRKRLPKQGRMPAKTSCCQMFQRRPGFKSCQLTPGPALRHSLRLRISGESERMCSAQLEGRRWLWRTERPYSRRVPFLEAFCASCRRLSLPRWTVGPERQPETDNCLC